MACPRSHAVVARTSQTQQRIAFLRKSELGTTLCQSSILSVPRLAPPERATSFREDDVPQFGVGQELS